MTFLHSVNPTSIAKYWKFFCLVCRLTSLNKLLASVDWYSILIESSPSCLTKIFFSILPVPYTYDSSLIKAKQAVRVCLCSSQDGSNTCRCSAMQAKIVFDYPKDEYSSKATLTSGRRGKRDSNRVGIENSKERKGLASPVNMKVGKLVVSTSSVRVYFSPL